MGSSIFPLGIDDGIVTVRSATFACYGYPYLMSIGWSFAFAALYSKTRLVNKMFCNPAFTALVLKKSDIVWPIGLLIGGKVSSQCAPVSCSNSSLFSEHCHLGTVDNPSAFALGNKDCSRRRVRSKRRNSWNVL